MLPPEQVAGLPPPMPPPRLPPLPDDVPQQAGFIFNKQLFCTTSRDGKAWSQPVALLGGCDTPQLATIGRDLYVYFVGRPNQPGDLSMERAPLLRSASGAWSLGPSRSLIIRDELPLGQTDPSLLRLADGRYRLYYVTPRPGDMMWSRPDPAYNRTEISSAISDDAAIWTKEPGVRLEGAGLVDPEAVLAPDGRVRLMYTSGTDLRVHSAISSDGKAFTPEQGTRANGGVTDTRRSRAGEYSMVFQGVPFGTDFPPLMYARSEDAFTFSSPEVLQIPGVPHPGHRLEAPSLVELEDGGKLLIFLEAPLQHMRSIHR